MFIALVILIICIPIVSVIFKGKALEKRPQAKQIILVVSISALVLFIIYLAWFIFFSDIAFPPPSS